MTNPFASCVYLSAGDVKDALRIEQSGLNVGAGTVLDWDGILNLNRKRKIKSRGPGLTDFKCALMGVQDAQRDA